MPSRSDGFAIMDVSTSICDDPKFRRIARENPEQVAAAFLVYVATMAESWKVGRRVPVDHAWPAYLSLDETIPETMRRVGLIDARGLVSAKAWRDWFEPARDRRDKARDRWARYNAKRDADTTPPPRGNGVATATSVPSVLPSVPSVPSGPSDTARAARDGERPLSRERTTEEALHDLSEEYKAGRLTDIEYSRKRKELRSA